MVFPQDVETLHRNSQHVRWRAQRCNANGLAVARMLYSHPLIERLNYPLFDESLPTYQSLMRRRGEAGYGSLMSVVFREASVAQRFYDALTLPKGSSFGTNFTIAVPFTLLVHYYNRHRVAAHGLPEHNIRISVGLEDVEDTKAVIQAALEECGGADGRSGTGAGATGLRPRETKL